MEGDTCSICAGEGRIPGPWGRSTVCPGCNGSGRRGGYDELVRNVTKPNTTRANQQQKAPAEKQTWPSTAGGMQLANEVRDCPTCPEDTKTRLIREIIEYEGSHGQCTKTFTRKVRKQLRATEKQS